MTNSTELKTKPDDLIVPFFAESFENMRHDALLAHKQEAILKEILAVKTRKPSHKEKRGLHWYGIPRKARNRVIAQIHNIIKKGLGE